MMYFVAYLLIGSIVSYGIFTILKELFQEFKYVYSRVDDDINTKEKDGE